MFLFQTDEVMKIEKMHIAMYAYSNNIKFNRCSLDNIDNIELNNRDVPIGTVEFVRKILNRMNIKEPDNISYPLELMTFLNRHVYHDTYENVPIGYFVKPVETKIFDGHIFTEKDKSIHDRTPVWVSEPVKWLAEYRYYIVDGIIVGYGRYDDLENDFLPDINIVKSAIEIWKSSPIGYSLDFGVLNNGKTALVEANDGWSLGYYQGSCSIEDYIKLIQKRWFEICK